MDLKLTIVKWEQQSLVNVCCRLLKFVQENDTPLTLMLRQKVVQRRALGGTDVGIPRSKKFHLAVEYRTVDNFECQRKQVAKTPRQLSLPVPTRPRKNEDERLLAGDHEMAQ